MGGPGRRRKASWTRRTPQQARSRATVEFVLLAAAQVFGERGYAATTNEIAERAGVSIGTLYQYFEDKDALLVALAEQHLAEARDRFGTALAGVDQRDEPAMIRSLVEVAVEVNRPSRLHQLLYSTAPRTPGLVAALDALHTDLAGAAAALLATRGVPDDVARRRGHALVVALDALVHDHVLTAPSPEDEGERIEDAVTLALAALRTWSASTAPARPPGT